MKSDLIFILCFVFSVQAKQGFGPGQQEWGYVEVQPENHIFSWFYQATSTQQSRNSDTLNTPLLIWLGYFSTAYSNFQLYGPLDTNLHQRNSSLVNDYHNLFIDSLIGTGFSYTDSNSDNVYNSNVYNIVMNIENCIDDFFRKFPKFYHVPIYILAESFHGKIAVRLATKMYNYTLDIGNGTAINMKGIILGNPLISPMDTIHSWVTFFQETHTLNDVTEEKIKKILISTKNHLDNYEWRAAYETASQLVDVALRILRTPEHIHYFEKLCTESMTDIISNSQLNSLMNNQVKVNLGLRSNWSLTDDKRYFDNLKNIIMIPHLHQLENILNKHNVQVVLLNSELDFEVATMNTLSWVTTLNWTYAEDWNDSTEKPFKVDKEFIAYVKEYKNLHQYRFIPQDYFQDRDHSQVLRQILQNLEKI